MLKSKSNFTYSTLLFIASKTAVFAAACVLLTLGGCSGSKSASEDFTAPRSGAPESSDVLDREIWDLCFLQGVRIGYVRTAYYRTAQSGKPAVRVQRDTYITITRNGQESKQQIRSTSLETPDGRLLGFKTEMQMGAEPTTITGRVVNNRLHTETASPGKKAPGVIDWSPKYGGFFADEQSLIRKPMQPGERRTLHALVEGFNQLITIEMLARDWQQTRLLHGAYELLRIDALAIFPDGNKFEQTIWTDRTGDRIKTLSQPMAMETFRATKEAALEKIEPGRLDIGLQTIVKLDKPLPNIHEARQAAYRVRLEGGDPAAVFAVGPAQTVKSLDANTAEVTVYAVRPEKGISPIYRNGPEGASHKLELSPFPASDPPTAADREPNNWIQSDNPKIIALAKEAVGNESDPWLASVRTEKFVHDYITRKDFSTAFASAAEVAETRQGDCTEHAVLLAALCRALGIPARVAIGLVYVPHEQGFGYHMWTEVYVESTEVKLNKSPLPLGEGKGEGEKDKPIISKGEGEKDKPIISKGEGEWIPIDATLAKGGIGAGHLKLAHSSLKGASAYSSFLPVVQVVGRLKIEPIEAE
jgi:hypothetical protein